MVALLKMPAMNAARPGAERRVFTRKQAQVSVMGRRLDHSVMARRFPTLRMHLRDISLGGISAIIDEPISQGERLCVSLPGSEMHSPWDAFGRVLRCEPSSTGYRIAVEFDLPAAA